MNLKLARIGKGWSLQNLADKLGISISYLSRIEKGERPIPIGFTEYIDPRKDAEWIYEIVKAIKARYHDSGNKSDELIRCFYNALKIKQRL